MFLKDLSDLHHLYFRKKEKTWQQDKANKQTKTPVVPLYLPESKLHDKVEWLTLSWLSCLICPYSIQYRLGTMTYSLFLAHTHHGSQFSLFEVISWGWQGFFEPILTRWSPKGLFECYLGWPLSILHLCVLSHCFDCLRHFVLFSSGKLNKLSKTHFSHL